MPHHRIRQTWFHVTYSMAYAASQTAFSKLNFQEKTIELLRDLNATAKIEKCFKQWEDCGKILDYLRKTTILVTF